VISFLKKGRVFFCLFISSIIIFGLIPVVSYASDGIADGVWLCTYWSGGNDCSGERIAVTHKSKDIMEIEGSWWWAYVAHKKGTKKLKGFWQPVKGKEGRNDQANPAEAYMENGKLKVRWQSEINGKVSKGSYSLYELLK